GLLECFAADRLTVAAPVLAAANLEPAQWRALLGHADQETRRFVETLHPELGAHQEPDATEALVEAEPPPKRAKPREPAAEPAKREPSGPSLSDVVARIERRRRNREQLTTTSAGPAQMPGAPSLFRWECGPSGEIAWIEGAPRGALIGRSLARSQDDSGGGVDEDIVRAFAMRAPFRDAMLSVPGDGQVSE